MRKANEEETFTRDAIWLCTGCNLCRASKSGFSLTVTRALVLIQHQRLNHWENIVEGRETLQQGCESLLTLTCYLLFEAASPSAKAASRATVEYIRLQTAPGLINFMAKESN